MTALPCLAQEKDLYTVAPGSSRVTFYAHATGHDFQGATQDVRGHIRFDPADLAGTVSGEVRVQASRLDTGIDRRNQNMWDLLEADKHRDIVFTLERISVEAEKAAHNTGTFPRRATLDGTLEVRGVQKAVTIPVELEPADGAVVVRGSFPVDMRDFGIEPPRVAFIMRTRPAVRVEFETRFKRAE